MAAVAVIGLVLLIHPDPLVPVPAAGLLLALLAAVLHAAYILLGRDGWGEIGDGAATFLIVATAAAGLGALTAVTRPATVLVPVTDLRLTTLLLLEGALAGAGTSIHLTQATTDRDVATGWFSQFEGAGLDGLIAKPAMGIYEPDKRVMKKIKHERTADCVVAGYRVHKSGEDRIGSLLLGLYRDDGKLASVGVIGAFPMEKRIELFTEMQPLVTTFDQHPWNWAEHQPAQRTPRAAMFSRWNANKDLSFIPLRPERVVEVRYDHMEGPRFRHTAQFVRWRPDREPRSCTYAQLEEPVSFNLAEILGGRRG